MTGGSRESQSAAAEREKRLAETLRANLKRRKAQKRGRAGAAASLPGKAKPDAG